MQPQLLTNPKNARFKQALLLILLLTLTVLVFHSVGEFQYLAIDDGMHTEMNPRMDPVSFKNILSFWTEPYENAYTPLTYTLWSLEALLAKNSPEDRTASITRMIPKGLRLNPGIFHLFNLLFHCLAAVAAYFLLIALFQHPVGAFLGALLFAIHPLQVETVCWITGQRDLLAGALSIAAAYFYLRYCAVTRGKIWALFSGPVFSAGNRYYLLALFCFFLSVLAKSSALVIPILIGILALLVERKKWFVIALEMLPWGLLVCPILPIFTSLNNSVALKVVFIPSLPWRPVIALDAIGFYLSKLFWPWHLAMDYARTPQFVLKQFQYGVNLSIALGVLSLSIYFYFKRKNFWPLASCAVFVLGLIPVLGFVPFIFQHISTVADRYVYLSMLGASMALTALVVGFEGRPTFRVVSYLLFLILGVRSATQVSVWRDNLSLFDHTLKETPHSWLAANDLGTVYEGLGEWDKAYPLYEHAAKLSNIASAWNNCGAMALELKNYEDAISAFTEALTASSFSPWAYNNLGTAYAKAGNLKEAKLNYDLALEYSPDFSYPKENIKKLRHLGLAAGPTLQVIRKN